MNLLRRTGSPQIAPLLVSAFLLLLFSALGAREVHAQTCSVFINATDGNDSNAGNQFAPVQSFEKGYLLAADGQRVCVAAGEYFRGADADGIVLADGSKNVRFVLQSFGGESEIRFSEEYFVADPQSGVLSFEATAGETLHFGVGILNTNAIHPVELNFLHTFEVRSGTLDFGSVPVSFGSSVGNTLYISPDTPDKQSPASAGIRLSGFFSFADLQFDDSPRRWFVSGSTGSNRIVPLSSLSAGSQLVTDASDTVSFPDGLFLGKNSSWTIGGGNVTLSGPVVLDDAAFLGISSANSMAMNLEMLPAARAELRLTGTGRLLLGGVSYGASSALDIDIRSGILETTAPLSLTGDLQVSGSLVAGTATTWTPADPSVDRFHMDGTLNAENGTFQAINASSAASIVVGTGLDWHGAPLQLTGAFTMGGAGSVPIRLVGTADVSLLDVDISGDLGVFADQSIVFGTGNTVIEGELSIQGGMVTILENSVPSTGRLVMESGQFQGNGSSLAVGDLARITGGSVNGLGLEFQASEAAFLSSTATLFSLNASSAPLTLASNVAVSGTCFLSGGQIVIPAASTLTCGSIEGSPSSALAIGVGAGLISTGMTDLRGVSVTGDEGSTLAAGPQLFTDHRTGTDLVTLRWLTSSSSWSSAPTFWKDVVWDNASAETTLSGEAGVHSELDLTANTLLLNAQSTLRLNGGALMSATPFGGNPSGSIVISGSGSLSGAPLTSIVLPSLIQEAGTLTVDTDLSLNGDLSLSGGETTIMPGKHISSAGTCSLTNGGRFFSVNSELSCSGSISLISNQLTFALNSSLTAGSDLEMGGQPTGTEHVTLNSTGVGNWVLPNGSSWKAWGISGTTTLLSEAASAHSISILESLTVAPGASLLHGDHSMVIGRAGGEGGSVENEGLISSTSGSVVFRGNSGSLTGSALPFSTEIDLSSSSLSVTYSGSELVSGARLVFTRGNLDLGNAGFSTLEDNVLGLSFNMSAGVLSGDLLIGQPALFNTENRNVDISIDGTVEGFPSLDPFLQFGPIRNLTMGVVDVLNDPPLFALRSVQPVVIQGSLSMTAGSRLDSPRIALTGTGSQHMLGGRLSSVLMSGSGLIDGIGSGQIEILNADAGEYEIQDLESVGSLSLDDAELTVSGLQTLSIGTSLVLINSTMNVSAAIEIGTQGESASVSLQSGMLVFDQSGSMAAISETHVASDAASFWSLEDSVSAGAGHLEFRQGGSLDIDSPLPRMRITGGATSVTLESPLLISDRLDLIGGALNLATYDLTIQSASWIHGDSHIGGSSGPVLPSVSLVGDVLLQLDAPLGLQQAHLEVDGNLTIENRSVAPSDIQILNGTLVGTNGSIALGGSDLTVAGPQDPLVSLDEFQISSDVVFPGVSNPPWFGQSESLFPFLNDEVGELVLNGTDGAVLTIGGNTSIDALRLQRSVSLMTEAAPLTIGKLLAFGANNASFLLEGDNALVVGAEGIIVRNGAGILSHSPVALGRIHIAYNLDDGDALDQPSGFSGSILNTGAEIPDGGMLGRLSIFAGDSGTGERTVRLQRSLSLASLGLFGGQFDQNGFALNLEDNADINFLQIEPDLSPVWTGSGTIQTSGSVDMQVSLNGQSMSLPQHLLSSVSSWNTVSVQLTTAPATLAGAILVVDGNLDTSSMRVEADPGSGVNLFGASVVADEFQLNGGELVSEPVSRLTVENLLTTHATSSIQGNIIVESLGVATMNGTVNTLEVSSRGDLAISGPWNARTKLVLGGSNAVTLITTPSFRLEHVTVRSTSADSRLTIQSTEALSFAIGNLLNLERGILNLENVSLLLEDSAQLLHTAGTWINGALKREVTSGFTGSVNFPVGGAMKSRTLQLVLTEPLVASSIFGATLIDAEPVIESGLPIPVGSAQAQDTGPFHWILTSSVNFANVQPFSLASPRSLHEASAISLVSRPIGTVSSPWRSDNLSSASTLRSAILTSGLNSTGLAVSTGQNQRNGDRAWVQIVRDAPQSINYPNRLFLEGQFVTTLSVPGSATPRFPVSLDGSGSMTTAMAFANPPGAATPVAETAFHVSRDDLHFVMAGLDPDASPALASSGPRVGPGIVFFNQNQAPDQVTVTRIWPTPVILAGSLTGRTFSPVSSMDDPTSAWSIAGSSGNESRVHFTPGIDDGQLSLVLIGADRTASLVAGDGSMRQAVDATHAETPDSAVPVSFDVTDVYPNPAVSSAKLKMDIPSAGSISIGLTDMIGRRVWTRRIDVQEGLSGYLLDLPVSNLAAGVYAVRLRYTGHSGESETVQRLIAVRH